MQANIITKKWLDARGYSVRAAAKALAKDAGHVSRVLSGKRKSAALLKALRALPRKRTRKQKGGRA